MYLREKERNRRLIILITTLSCRFDYFGCSYVQTWCDHDHSNIYFVQLHSIIMY